MRIPKPLRELTEYVLIHSQHDGYTVADLTHDKVGMTMMTRRGKHVEVAGTFDECIDQLLDQLH